MIYSGKIHWRKRKAIADYFHDLVLEDCQQLVQIEKKVNLKFEFYFKSRYLDSSNTTFMGKCIEDGLRKGGLLIDDTNKYVGSFTCESILIDPKERKKMKTDFIRIIIN